MPKCVIPFIRIEMDEKLKANIFFCFLCSLIAALQFLLGTAMLTCRFYCWDLDVHVTYTIHTVVHIFGNDAYKKRFIRIFRIRVFSRPTNVPARYFRMENRHERSWSDLMATFLFIVPSMFEFQPKCVRKRRKKNDELKLYACGWWVAYAHQRPPKFEIQSPSQGKFVHFCNGKKNTIRDSFQAERQIQKKMEMEMDWVGIGLGHKIQYLNNSTG